MPSEILHLIDQISQDLDMTVYRLESSPPEDVATLVKERHALRKELEKYRERLEELAQRIA